MMLHKQLGRYEIIELLGRGSMGVVYKAHDPLIERMVAIKTISYAGLTPDEVKDFEQRFFLEAKSAGRLNHPNIVTIYDVGHSEGFAYIAMELLAGQSLRAVLDSGVVLPAKRIARIAYSVANGLAFAHTNGVIHRDIKPANIMVLDNSLVKITDFGIALLPSGSLTMAGTAVGSPKYMSPEQILGQKADNRSDIFSLGAMLYEMLTGSPPFMGADLNATLYQVLNVAPPLPSSINADIPPSFDRIVARALAKDPGKRYQTAAEMAADVRNFRKLPGLMQSARVATSEASATLPALEAKQSSEAPAAAVSSPPSPLNRRLALAISAFVLALGGYLWFAQAEPPLVPPPVASAVPVRAPSAAPVTAASAPAPATLTPVVQAQASQATAVAPEPAAPSAEKRLPAAEKPAAKPKVQKTKPVLKDADNKPKPQAKKASAPPSEEKKPRVSDWKTQLRSDLAACEADSFFSRVLCKEKARWKHCPGHWGSVDECPQNPRAQ